MILTPYLTMVLVGFSAFILALFGVSVWSMGK